MFTKTFLTLFSLLCIKYRQLYIGYKAIQLSKIKILKNKLSHKVVYILFFKRSYRSN